MIPLPNMETFDGANPWTNVTFSRCHHGNKFKFRRKDNDNVIQAKLNDSNQHILLKQIINTKLINKISIEFTIRNHIENSIIGIIKYPLQCATMTDTEQKELDIESIALYGDKPLQQTPFCDSYYGIGTTEHIDNECMNEFRIWRPSQPQTKQMAMDFAIKSGDKLIMVINGRDKECKIYLNHINDNYLICDHKNNQQYTFKDIPQQFVVIYGAHSIDLDKKDNKKKKVDVEVKLLQLIANASQIKRKRKSKIRKNKGIISDDSKEEKKEEEKKKRNNLKPKKEENNINDDLKEDEKGNTDKNHENGLKPINKNVTQNDDKTDETDSKKKQNTVKGSENKDIKIVLNRKTEGINDTKKKRRVSQKQRNVSETMNKKQNKGKKKSKSDKHWLTQDIDIDIDIDDYDWSGFGSKRKADIDEKQRSMDTSESSDDDDDYKRKKRKQKRRKSLKRKKKQKDLERRKSAAHISEREYKKLKKKKHKKRRKSRQHLAVTTQSTDDDTEDEHSHSVKTKKKKRKQRRKSARMAEEESDRLRRKRKKKKRKRRHSHNANRMEEDDDEDDEDDDVDNNSKYGKHLQIKLPNDDDEQRFVEIDDDGTMVVSPRSALSRSTSLPPPPERPKKSARQGKPPPPSTPPPSLYLKTAHRALVKLDNDVMVSDECYLIGKCLSIKRIKVLLEFYQKILNQMFGKNDIIENYYGKYKHLLNDYHHILRVHLNGTKSENNAKFAAIYEIINEDIKCDIKTCYSFRRNNRNRDNYIPLNNERLHFYIGILDTIHCLFIHSYDAGYRLYTQNDMKQSDDDWYTDNTLKHLNETLSDKYKELSSIRGVYRMKINKFDNDFRGDNFGTRFYYWDYYRDNEDCDIHYNPGYKYCDLYIATKYDDLRTEIMNNAIYTLEKKQFVCIQFAAQIFLNSNHIRSCVKQETDYAEYQNKQRVCDRVSADELFYRISSYSKITIEHLMSIILYTDYIEFQMFFRNTFKRLSHRNEAYLLFKDRNREFAHCSRLLRESIEIYGEWISSSNDCVMYCSISNNVIFCDAFCCNISVPISVSSQLCVVSLYQYSCDVGFVLELSCNRDSEIGMFLKYFNSSFLSRSSFESERVFIGGWAPITISSILCVKKNHNYKYFFDSISILNSVMNGEKSKIKANEIHCLIIDKLIRKKINEIPPYPTQIFESFIQNVHIMSINIDNMTKSCFMLKKYFIAPPIHDDKQVNIAEMLSFKDLTKLCPQCIDIVVFMTNSNNMINHQYLSLFAPIIKYIDQDNDIKLQSITFNNIGNRCSDKALNAFKSYLNTNKLKWSININKNKSKNKYQYLIVKQDGKGKASLMKKMKGMFGQK